MKKIVFLFLFASIFTNVYSNPIPVPPIMSEIYLNGNEIQIEFYMEEWVWWGENNFDNLSLVSSIDTIEFNSGIAFSFDEVFVLDQNNLVSGFQYNPLGDHIYMIDETGYPINEGFRFGNYPNAQIAAPNEFQSMAYHRENDLFNNYYYYVAGIEQPTSIGYNEFTIVARGLLKGIIVDLNNTPVQNVEILHPLSNSQGLSPSFTNQNGEFIMSNLIARSIHFNFYKNSYHGSFNASIMVYDTTFVELQLDSIFAGLIDYNNYPNPFADFTSFSLKIPDNIKFAKGYLGIYNIQGKLIDRIEIESNMRSVQWFNNGNSPGVYLYNVVIDNKQFAHKKMILL